MKLPNCVPLEVYKPDDIPTRYDWEHSNLKCPHCGSDDTWEAQIPDGPDDTRGVFECDNCDYRLEE